MEEVYGGTQPQEHGRLDEVKSKAHQASDAAKRKLVDKADEQKGQLVSRLERIADELDEVSRKAEGPEGQIFSRLSGYVRRADSMIQGKRADELARVAAREIKERPGLLVAGCFAAGFLGARLLKD